MEGVTRLTFAGKSLGGGPRFQTSNMAGFGCPVLFAFCAKGRVPAAPQGLGNLSPVTRTALIFEFEEKPMKGSARLASGRTPFGVRIHLSSCGDMREADKPLRDERTVLMPAKRSERSLATRPHRQGWAII